MDSHLYVVALISPKAGRVDLLGVFSTHALADHAAREHCPQGAYWDIVAVQVDEVLPIQGEAEEFNWFAPPTLSEAEKCPECKGAGLNEERTDLCGACRGNGRKVELSIAKGSA